MNSAALNDAVRNLAVEVRIHHTLLDLAAEKGHDKEAEAHQQARVDAAVEDIRRLVS